MRIRRSPRRRWASAAGSGVIIAIVPTEVVVIVRFSPMPARYAVPAGVPECRPCARSSPSARSTSSTSATSGSSSARPRSATGSSSGVSADALNLRKKGREPVFSQGERMAIVGALKRVDEVFVEESLELKRHYIEQFRADVLVMGDDWAGRFDEFGDICEVVYLPRTPAISTTALIEKISAAT